MSHNKNGMRRDEEKRERERRRERERARTLRCDLFGLFFLVIKQNRKRRRRRSGITRWAGMKTKETTRQ